MLNFTGTAIAGKNIANPIAMLNASVDMLNHLGNHCHADLIENAIKKTISVDLVHTPDLKGTATSMDVVQSILANLAK